MVESGRDVGGVESNELEGLGGNAESSGGVDGEVREAEEGDGRVGVGDAVDVGVDGGEVKEASGEEDGDGVCVVVVVEELFA